jgi:uncharacterized membrane protein
MLKAVRSRSEATDLLIAIAVALLGLAALATPDTVLRLGPPCLITHVLGVWCAGCGITHAAIDLLHGDVAAAWAHNRLSLLVLPLLLLLYLRHLRKLGRRYLSRSA